MSAHTEGPWYQDPTGDVGFWFIGTPEKAIAEVCPGDYGGRDVSEPEREANARLISKAWLLPEMVEALRELSEIDHGFCIGCGKGGKELHSEACPLCRLDALLQRYEESDR